jgi:DNA-binding MarR family transcriptional regulator/GNAT superfamily N-acetyltransferase
VARKDMAQRIAAVRRFNRFYTRRIGVVRGGILGSPYTLAQVRVLYEIAHGKHPTATDLGKDLGLDGGYLSRILRGFEKEGFLRRTRSASDGRKRPLALTARGRAALAPLDRASRREVGGMLRGVPEADLSRLESSMGTIEEILGGREAPPRRCLLRTHRPGDLGWIVHRHGLLYARERGWDGRFEAMVADIVGAFGRSADPARERCWIAEEDGKAVGSVLLARASKVRARLRLLLVEPWARRRGIGRRLVEECIRFARRAGYRTLELWTDAGLLEARRIYGRCGFRKVRTEKARYFGADFTGETWALTL